MAASPDTVMATAAAAERRLEITQVSAPATVGGSESVVATLATELAKRGHRSRVIALFGPAPEQQCEPFARLRQRGVELVELRLPSRAYRAEIGQLAAMFRQSPGTIVHSHGYHADFVAWRAAREANVAVMSTVHGFTGGTLRNRIYEWIDLRVLPRFDAVVAVSRPLASQLQRAGVKAERLHLIPNCWAPAEPPLQRRDARRVLGLSGDGPVVGWVGRLSQEKGPDVFLEAVARLSGNVVASVVGDGNLRPGLEAMAERLGIGSRIRWHGVVPEAGRLLTAFDVVVLSSRTEGTPIVLLEALAFGVPVVATAVGGVPDVVPGGEALLVPADDPARLSEAIANSLGHPGEAAARAARGQARLGEAYRLEPWLARYETAYQSLPCR